jgi:hypothetical protein
MSLIIDTIIADLKARELKGLETYGTTVDRPDLTLLEWLRHSYEEKLDDLVYMRKAIDLLEQQTPHEAINSAATALASLESIDEALHGSDVKKAKKKAIEVICNALLKLK